MVGSTLQIRNEFRMKGEFVFRWGELGLGEHTPRIQTFFPKLPMNSRLKVGSAGYQREKEGSLPEGFERAAGGVGIEAQADWADFGFKRMGSIGRLAGTRMERRLRGFQRWSCMQELARPAAHAAAQWARAVWLFWAERARSKKKRSSVEGRRRREEQ